MYPQPRLGTRYEKSLKRRFEKADQVFSEIYLRKARLDKKGLRAYTAVELRQDLYAAAFGHGLCAEALMAYFQVLHRRECLKCNLFASPYSCVLTVSFLAPVASATSPDTALSALHSRECYL